jgi:hypothetical protein
MKIYLTDPLVILPSAAVVLATAAYKIYLGDHLLILLFAAVVLSPACIWEYNLVNHLGIIPIADAVPAGI